ncbi:MAG: hypothetical protein JWO85_930 [Candidatus Eremiobacteraeota bacterium]|jgi:hypothetical protein|nr:hypothetical protein [Candidatus Eremiobacteraeota bacterium]
MEHVTTKLGTALAATVLGLGIPAAAVAQDDSTGVPSGVLNETVMTDMTVAADTTPLDAAAANLESNTQALVNLGSVSAGDVAVVSMSDMNLSADQRYSVAQNIDPSTATALQQALNSVTVSEYGGDSPTLANHLQSLGIDPAGVVAVDVGADGVVTIFTQ